MSKRKSYITVSPHRYVCEEIRDIADKMPDLPALFIFEMNYLYSIFNLPGEMSIFHNKYFSNVKTFHNFTKDIYAFLSKDIQKEIDNISNNFDVFVKKFPKFTYNNMLNTKMALDNTSAVSDLVSKEISTIKEYLDFGREIERKFLEMHCQHENK